MPTSSNMSMRNPKSLPLLCSPLLISINKKLMFLFCKERRECKQKKRIDKTLRLISAKQQRAQQNQRPPLHIYINQTNFYFHIFFFRERERERDREYLRGRCGRESVEEVVLVVVVCRAR